MKYILSLQNRFSKREHKLFVISMVVLNFYLWIGVFEGTFRVPHLVKYLLSLYVLGSIFYYCLKNRTIPHVNGISRLALLFFAVWSILLLVGSFRTDVFYIQEILGARYYFIPFLLPLLFLFARYELYFFKILLKATYILIFLALSIQIYSLIFKYGIETWAQQYNFIMLFDLAAPLLLLVSHLYKNKSVSIVVIIYFVITVFLAALWGRRGWLLENLLLFLLFIIIRYRSTSVHPIRKFNIAFISAAIVIALVVFSELYAHKLYVFERGLNKEGWEDSRGRVVDDFFKDFNSPTDWILGRGINGTVLRTIVADQGDQGRSTEIGYMNILLKGGLLYLLPMLILFINSIYLGFFKTNNDLTKALGSMVIIQIFAMSTFGMADFSPRYIIIWIAVAACFNPRIRAISNKKLIIILNKPLRISNNSSKFVAKNTK